MPQRGTMRGKTAFNTLTYRDDSAAIEEYDQLVRHLDDPACGKTHTDRFSFHRNWLTTRFYIQARDAGELTEWEDVTMRQLLLEGRGVSTKTNGSVSDKGLFVVVGRDDRKPFVGRQGTLQWSRVLAGTDADIEEEKRCDSGVSYCTSNGMFQVKITDPRDGTFFERTNFRSKSVAHAYAVAKREELESLLPPVPNDLACLPVGDKADDAQEGVAHAVRLRGHSGQFVKSVVQFDRVKGWTWVLACKKVGCIHRAEPTNKSLVDAGASFTPGLCFDHGGGTRCRGSCGHKCPFGEHGTILGQLSEKYGGRCLTCFINEYIDTTDPELRPLVDKAAPKHKTKELAVRSVLAAAFPDYDWVFDRSLGNRSLFRGDPKYRPDARVQSSWRVLIVEIDENRHVRYSCSGERAREAAIVQYYLRRDERHEVVLIRFNPDSFIDLKTQKRTRSPWKHSTKQAGMVLADEEEWKRRTDCLVDVVKRYMVPVGEEGHVQVPPAELDAFAPIPSDAKPEDRCLFTVELFY